MSVYQKALDAHAKWKGKIETTLKEPITDREVLGLAYTPGVAQPCREIANNPEDIYKYTWKGNTVAVVSDGSAVLGLGNIGARASMPVMEGKACLFKQFGQVDAVPIILDTQDTEAIIATVKAIAPTFGGINLEDIAAPQCVEIERRLIEELDIPVFHDDQHGTAIVVAAGLINSLKLVNKKPEDVTVVVSGTGAAGNSIIRILNQLKVKEIYGFNINGIIIKEDADKYGFLEKELMDLTNYSNKRLTMEEAMKEADVFVGVSAAGLVSYEMVKSMKKDPIVFAMANPEPEITYELAKEAGAAVVGTGRSDAPNQVNNILAFPGIFRGALDCRATKITEEMKMAAAVGLASLVSEDELTAEYVIPDAFNPNVAKVVADEVVRVARETGIAKA
ncbi:MAG: NAD-dependent malic enzyme [Erysipelothrix sp.]|nr:NAD-dependent malic enzyme [Erysipelothrix sp.]